LQDIFSFFFPNPTIYFLRSYKVFVFEDKAARVWSWLPTPFMPKFRRMGAQFHYSICHCGDQKHFKFACCPATIPCCIYE